MNWQKISVSVGMTASAETITSPPEGVPVWLFEDGRAWIGTYEYEDDGWYYTRCYGMPYLDRGEWVCFDAERDDDYNPTHWMPLPKAPE